MATKQKIWIDGRGREVPPCYVGKYDKARDKAVRHVLAGALKLRSQMEAFMADAVKTRRAWASAATSLRVRSTRSYRCRSTSVGTSASTSASQRRGN